MQQGVNELITVYDDNFNFINISKQQVISFFNNLDTEDKKEIRNWTVEDFVSYVEKEHPFILLDNNKNIIAMGDANYYIDGLGLERCGLWLLVTPEIRRYSNAKRLIKACVNILTQTIKTRDIVTASTLAENRTHRAFIEKILGLELLHCDEGREVIYVSSGKNVLKKLAGQTC